MTRARANTTDAKATAPPAGVLQRAAARPGEGAVPAVVYDVLRVPLDAATRAFFEPRFGADFADVRAPAPVRVQAKLRVNEPGDRYEQEADRVAERVMRTPEAGVQRTCACGAKAAGDCEECRKKEASAVQRLATGPAATQEAPASVASVVGQPGQPLDAGARAFFEPRLGRDLSAVRVHTDAAAAASAAEIQARAYTVGPHIAFAAGEFAPGTAAGRSLLAHELVHVEQQSGGARAVQRSIEGCRSILQTAGATSLIAGSAVHALVEQHFLGSVAGALKVGIPGASSGPARSQGICGGDTTVINPQIVGGMSGMGFPDLARVTTGRILQVAELKPAAVVCLIDGEEQLLRYVTQGTGTDAAQQSWRAGLGVSVVAPMPESAYTPPTVVTPTFRIEFAWCSPGLLAYAVTAQGAPVPVRVPREERDQERERARRETAERVRTGIGVGVGAGVAVAVGRALWPHFWKVVGRRFAVRGAAMLALAAADGPLPFGELIDLGIAAATAIQIIVQWDDIWSEADRDAAQGA